MEGTSSKCGRGKRKNVSFYLLEDFNYVISVTKKIIHLAPLPNCSCVRTIMVFSMNFSKLSTI